MHAKCLSRPAYLMKVRRTQDGSQVADQRLLLGSRNILKIIPQPSLCPCPQDICRDYTQNTCKDYRNASRGRHSAGLELCAVFCKGQIGDLAGCVNLLVSSLGTTANLLVSANWLRIWKATLKLSLQLSQEWLIAWCTMHTPARHLNSIACKLDML